MKRLLAIVLTVAILVGVAPTVSMAATVKYKTTQIVTLKKSYKPSKTLMNIPKGKQVVYKGSKTYKKVKWYYVQYGNKKGYIQSKYLKKLQHAPTTKIYQVVKNTSLRDTLTGNRYHWRTLEKDSSFPVYVYTKVAPKKFKGQTWVYGMYASPQINAVMGTTKANTGWVPLKSLRPAYNGFLYTTKGNKVTLLSYSGKAKDVVVPSHINGKKVVSLGNIFYGTYLYEHRKFNKLIIPGTISEIKSSDFERIWAKSIVLKEGVKKIDENAFALSHIQSISLPNSITSVSSRAFIGINGLTSVTIPHGLSTLPDLMFVNCSELKSVTIPKSVKAFAGDPFAGCGLKTVYFKGGAPSLSGAHPTKNGYNIPRVPFAGSTPTIYYHASTSGWDSEPWTILTQFKFLPY